MSRFVTCDSSWASTAAQLALVHHPQDSLGAADGGVARVASGGEGVRLLGRREVEPRHRDPGLGGELGDDRVEPRLLGLAHRIGTHRAQRELVAVEVGEAVDAERDHQRDDQARSSRR